VGEATWLDAEERREKKTTGRQNLVSLFAIVAG